MCSLLFSRQQREKQSLPTAPPTGGRPGGDPADCQMTAVRWDVDGRWRRESVREQRSFWFF